MSLWVCKRTYSTLGICKQWWKREPFDKQVKLLYMIKSELLVPSTAAHVQGVGSPNRMGMGPDTNLRMGMGPVTNLEWEVKLYMEWDQTSTWNGNGTRCQPWNGRSNYTWNGTRHQLGMGRDQTVEWEWDQPISSSSDVHDLSWQ